MLSGRSSAGQAAPRLGQNDDWGSAPPRPAAIQKKRPRQEEEEEEEEGVEVEAPNYSPVPEYAPVHVPVRAPEHALVKEHVEEKEYRFFCPDRYCNKCYTTATGLYQHKRAHHPWLINSRRDTYDDDERRFRCPEPGCDKAYATSMGIYQHKRAKHPWLINQRERGYTRPSYRKL